MKKTALVLCATLAVMTLSACADRHDEVAVGVAAGPNYDAYYDDYYGPFYDGYWAPDGFYFSDGPDHPFRHDDAGHFRHEASNGFHAVHGSGMHGPGEVHHG